MIAMRFGTVPVVRETGGLKDSVTPYNQYTGQGRGFTFAQVDPDDMLWTLQEAVALFQSDRKAWRALMKAGMTADFTWNLSAREYADIYNAITG